MRSVFLRYDIGMSSECSFAKMERVLASLRVQSYNAKKRNPNFLQICGVSKTQNNENTRTIILTQVSDFSHDVMMLTFYFCTFAND